nr:pyrroline-5-carboxylate reductase [Campylobacter sp.]
MKVYILGSGAMGKAMAFGLKDSGFDVVIVGRTRTSVMELKKIGFETELYGERYDITGKNIILAFKPYALELVSKMLIGKAAICVSVLARTDLATLKSSIRSLKYAVCLPNLAAEFRASITPFIGDEAANEIINGFGQSVRFESDREFTAAGVISGCAPAFLAMVAESLANGAVAQGVKFESAYKLVSGLFDSVSKLLGNTHPALLKDAVCSPAGTTIEGVAKLEECGIRSAFIKAVEASSNKQNSK